MRRQANREQDIADTMALLERAADNGLPCPTNTQIADLLGMMSRSGGHKLLAEMERRGLVKLDREHGVRNITIVGRAASPARYNRQPPRIDESRLTRVDSRACFNCGAAYARCNCHRPIEILHGVAL